MAIALAVTSLYFLYAGFRLASAFCLSLGGIAAGLCLASSISGKQYLLALAIAAPLYALFYWRSLKRSVTWTSLALVLYGFLAGAATILLYIVFNRTDYTLYPRRTFFVTSGTLRDRHPFRTASSHSPSSFTTAFSAIPCPRFFIPDTLPIPLPYYSLLLPGIALTVWKKRFEIVLLAIIPVQALLSRRLLTTACCWQSPSG